MDINFSNRIFNYMLNKNLYYAKKQQFETGVKSLKVMFPVKTFRISGLNNGGLSRYYFNKLQLFTVYRLILYLFEIEPPFFIWKDYFDKLPRGASIKNNHLENSIDNKYIISMNILDKSFDKNYRRTYNRNEYYITEFGEKFISQVEQEFSKNNNNFKSDVESIIYGELIDLLRNPVKKGLESGIFLLKRSVNVYSEKKSIIFTGGEEIETDLMLYFLGDGYKIYYIDNHNIEETSASLTLKEYIRHGSFNPIESENKWNDIKNLGSNPNKTKEFGNKLQKVIFIEPPPLSIIETLYQAGICTVPSYHFAYLSYDYLKTIRHVEKCSDGFIKEVPTKVLSSSEEIKDSLDENEKIVLRPPYKTEKENGRNVFICNKDSNIIKIYNKLYSDFKAVCLQKFIEGPELITGVLIDKFKNIEYLDPIGYKKLFNDKDERHSANHIISWYPPDLSELDKNKLRKSVIHIFSNFVDESGIYTLELKRNEMDFFCFGEMDWHSEDTQNMITYWTHEPSYDVAWANVLTDKYPILKPIVKKEYFDQYIVSHSIQKSEKNLWKDKILNGKLKCNNLRKSPIYSDNKLGYVAFTGKNLKNILLDMEKTIHKNMRCNNA